MDTAIVTGGTGALGRVVASALLNNGVRVAIPVRGRPKGEPLTPHGETAAIYSEADISTEPGAAAFVRERNRMRSRLSGRRSSSGGRSLSRIIKQRVPRALGPECHRTIDEM